MIAAPARTNGGSALPAERTSVALMGVSVDNVSQIEAVDRIESMIASRTFHQVATVNADFLINARKDREVQCILCQCDLVLADGMPVVWASRLLGAALKERVAGVDLVDQLAARSAKRGYRIYLLGARPEIARKAAGALQKRYPGLDICGMESPPVSSIDAMDNDGILARIEAAHPDILLVAFGNPKQEKWIALHRDRLRIPVCIGIGGSLDMLSGSIRRAPLWMQNSGLEWVFRLLQEPDRLAKRYAVDALGLARHMSVQLGANLLQSRAGSDGVFTTPVGGNLVIRLLGDVTGCATQLLEQLAVTGLNRGSHLIVDCRGVAFMGTDAIGCLIRLDRLARKRQGSLVLAGAGSGLLGILRASLVDHQFCMSPDVPSALRRISPGSIHLSIELGEGWSKCSVAGTPNPVQEQTLGNILQDLIQASDQLHLDGSEAPGIDLRRLTLSSQSQDRLVAVTPEASPIEFVRTIA